MPIDLSECSVGELMEEVQRRLDCQSKPEKRVILIGACFSYCAPNKLRLGVGKLPSLFDQRRSWLFPCHRAVDALVVWLDQPPLQLCAAWTEIEPTSASNKHMK